MEHRLTYRDENETARIIKRKGNTLDAIEKLAWIEDAEEQGRQFISPVAIGQTVYAILRNMYLNP